MLALEQIEEANTKQREFILANSTFHQTFDIPI